MLDSIVNFLPSPVDKESVEGLSPKIIISLKEKIINEPLTGLVFKMVNDKFVGKLAFIRIYSGELKCGQNVYNPRVKKEKELANYYVYMQIIEKKYKFLKLVKLAEW